MAEREESTARRMVLFPNGYFTTSIIHAIKTYHSPSALRVAETPRVSDVGTRGAAAQAAPI
jgi:hypothetical protein